MKSKNNMKKNPTLMILMAAILLVCTPAKVFAQNNAKEWWEPVSAKLANGTTITNEKELVKMFGYIMIARSSSAILVYQYYTNPKFYITGGSLPANTRDMRNLKGLSSLPDASSTPNRIQIRPGIITIQGESLTYNGQHPEGIYLMDGIYTGICSYKRCQSLEDASTQIRIQETNSTSSTNTPGRSYGRPVSSRMAEKAIAEFGVSMNVESGYEVSKSTSDIIEIAKTGNKEGDSRIVVKKGAPSTLASWNEQKCIRDATQEAQKAKAKLESFDGWRTLELGGKEAVQYQFYMVDTQKNAFVGTKLLYPDTDYTREVLFLDNGLSTDEFEKMMYTIKQE